ncbi:MAG: KamA family radical SAM protein [Desulfosarcinaceae bacterium]|nr:KamA family radical SAM protein [Desulfosarcinaceae bacterium]
MSSAVSGNRIAAPAAVADHGWQRLDWQEILARSVTREADLPPRLAVATDGPKVADTYPVRINPYFLDLIEQADDPLGLQALPDLRELAAGPWEADPFREERLSPVPHLIHRYADRVVFLVSSQCALYCRHCMRKRRVGDPLAAAVDPDARQAGLDYIARTETIRDVILSGGDPLLLDDEALAWLLGELRRIPHVEILRIHSRILSSLPQRVTGALTDLLRRHQPLYLNTQFNHPREMTAIAAAACRRLADAGIPLGNQTVLLQGVNDDAAVLRQLFRRLLALRVRPYYLHHPDQVRGTRHFWCAPRRGLDLMAALRGRISGLAIPQYVIDLPGGHGKVPLTPESVVSRQGDRWRIRSYTGEIVDYCVDPGGPDAIDEWSTP